ncbi:NAD(P)-dependent oxidoreductase [Nocardioides fonticola]|uniref:NAD(P)-dependent oxidoreductase n=1 Tax=Nocardioides fonticola TaxID=450363 RepID=A0ABP7XFE2_9ACTN
MGSLAPRLRDPVLVTGAFGLVGRAVVERLLADGRAVVASDLDTPAFHRWARRLGRLHGERGAFRADPADLTDEHQTRHLVWSNRPRAVVHLAAVIPPACYQRPGLARRVNVEATGHLVEAVAAASAPPRFVLASSVAVYGRRNPHRTSDLLTAATPVAPSDLYGEHKVEAETLVRERLASFAVLRLGGVLSADVGGAGTGMASMDFEGMLPTDQRITTVEVRDVARAFAAAVALPDDVLAAVAGRTFLIGGDETHRLVQGAITPAITAAMGLEDAVPPGRPGDPDDDASWFATDWMDTAESQAVLDYQRISWPDLLQEVHDRAGARRYAFRLAAPVLNEVIRRRPARLRAVGRTHADPWGDVAATFGSPREH